MKGLTAVIPYRVDPDGIRRRNLEVVLRWLASADLAVILVEHADDPDEGLRVSETITRLHVPAAGAPFNKAQACNAAFEHVTGSLLALVDADTVMPMDAFLASAVAAQTDLDVVRPYGRLIELDEKSTVDIAAGGPMPETASGGHDDQREGEHIPLCGGLVILRTSAYESVGGMDSTFQGWGGEDDALSVALLRSGLRCGIDTESPALHLAHPRTPESRYGHAHYASNRARAAWWHEADDESFAAAVAAGRARLSSSQP